MLQRERERERERESFVRNNVHNGVVSGAARGRALLGPMITQAVTAVTKRWLKDSELEKAGIFKAGDRIRFIKALTRR